MENKNDKLRLLISINHIYVLSTIIHRCQEFSCQFIELLLKAGRRPSKKIISYFAYYKQGKLFKNVLRFSKQMQAYTSKTKYPRPTKGIFLQRKLKTLWTGCLLDRKNYNSKCLFRMHQKLKQVAATRFYINTITFLSAL